MKKKVRKPKYGITFPKKKNDRQHTCDKSRSWLVLVKIVSCLEGLFKKNYLLPIVTKVVVGFLAS